MTLPYEVIFSRTRNKIYDPKELSLNPDDLIEIYTERLHSSASDPRIRKLFSTFILDDETQTLTYEFVHFVDKGADQDFIIELMVIGMTIEWLQPQVMSIKNTATMIGGKEEKKILDINKNMFERLDTLKTQRYRMIRDYGYMYNNYILGE